LGGPGEALILGLIEIDWDMLMLGLRLSEMDGL